MNKSVFENDTDFFKSMEITEGGLIKSKELGIGTTRMWKGKKYIKVAKGHWKPVEKKKESFQNDWDKLRAETKIETDADVKKYQNEIKSLHERAKKLAIGNKERASMTLRMRFLAYKINYATTKEGNRGSLTPAGNYTVEQALAVANKELSIKDAEGKTETVDFEKLRKDHIERLVKDAAKDLDVTPDKIRKDKDWMKMFENDAHLFVQKYKEKHNIKQSNPALKGKSIGIGTIVELNDGRKVRVAGFQMEPGGIGHVHGFGVGPKPGKKILAFIVSKDMGVNRFTIGLDQIKKVRDEWGAKTD